MSRFAFFHVGQDVTFPTKMVASLKAVMPEATVIMCTDYDTPQVEGVDEYGHSEVDKDQLMYCRMRAFANLRLTQPTMYIDTDMLFVLPVDPTAILGEREIIFCRRDFDRDAGFNGAQRNGMFKQWHGIPLGTLFPYLGCATITKDYHPWLAMSLLMSMMDKERRSWYGDQEALKVYSYMLRTELVGEFSEAEYACLPDKRREDDVPRILHYKGPARKEAFLNA
jgi:hypothetical protein